MSKRTLAVVMMAGCLCALGSGADESAAAKAERLKADLAAREKEFADLEQRTAAKKAEIEALRVEVSGAEHEKLVETAGEAATGDPAGIEALLGRIDGGRVADAELAAPFMKGKVAGGKVAPLVDRQFKASADSMVKAKLCWILGVNGTLEAAALLREYLASEKDVTVLSNAMQALASCGRDEKNVAAIRAFLDQKERPSAGFGYYSAVSLGEQAARLAGRPDAKNATVPGEVVVEEPTAMSLGLEWKIEGDANLDCRVDVAYRRTGEEPWKPAMPLLRVEPGGYPEAGVLWKGADPGNLLAGSILFLQPDTEYEVKLALSDPDGGKAEKIVRAKTRSEPAVPQGMRVRHVVPGSGGGSGTLEDPFKGIETAHAAAQPGDLFLLGAGKYDGPFVFTKSGAAEKPIVWRGTDRDKVMLDGGGKERALNLSGLKHVFVEKVTVQNAGKMGVCAWKAEGVVFRRCRIRNCGYGGIFAPGPCRDLTITDNEIEGPAAWEQKGPRKSCYGVTLNGTGHILAYNTITEWWDCISLASDDQKVITRSVDVYGNEISKATDKLRPKQNFTPMYHGESFKPTKDPFYSSYIHEGRHTYIGYEDSLEDNDKDHDLQPASVTRGISTPKFADPDPAPGDPKFRTVIDKNDNSATVLKKPALETKDDVVMAGRIVKRGSNVPGVGAGAFIGYSIPDKRLEILELKSLAMTIGNASVQIPIDDKGYPTKEPVKLRAGSRSNLQLHEYSPSRGYFEFAVTLYFAEDFAEGDLAQTRLTTRYMYPDSTDSRTILELDAYTWTQDKQ
jgi:hypothetical protein